MAERTVRIDGRDVAVTNCDKVLFPDDGLTKGDLVDYYRRIALTALPLWRDRPLTMHRFPDGIGAAGFYQKNAPDSRPEWIRTARVARAEGEGEVEHILVNDAATFVFIANSGCITPHLALSRVDRLDRPDRLIFDLDPSDNDFAKVRRAARRLRRLLDELRLPSFIQTTGSRGIHVLVPLDRGADFEVVRGLARRCADLLVRRHPDELTVAQRKAERGDRVFVDYVRNSYGQTAVAPYAIRPRRGAPVATPLAWGELGSQRIGPATYTVRNIFRRLAQKEDPWRALDRRPASVGAAMGRLERLAGSVGVP